MLRGLWGAARYVLPSSEPSSIDLAGPPRMQAKAGVLQAMNLSPDADASPTSPADPSPANTIDVPDEPVEQESAANPSTETFEHAASLPQVVNSGQVSHPYEHGAISVQ